MSKPAKTKYKTTNWKEYNAALKARGSLLVWLDQDIRWDGSASGKRGRSQKYSEAAIQFCLTIKSLFNLALRQAMGMAQSLLKLAGLASARFQHRQSPPETPGCDDWRADMLHWPASTGGQHRYQDNCGDILRLGRRSGRQKQRILLARALYKRPKILFLDEATSHLDVEREKQVNSAIQELNMTRIIIAHRPETIASAGRVIALFGGKVVNGQPALAQEHQENLIQADGPKA